MCRNSYFGREIYNNHFIKVLVVFCELNKKMAMQKHIFLFQFHRFYRKCCLQGAKWGKKKGLTVSNMNEKLIL